MRQLYLISTLLVSILVRLEAQETLLSGDPEQDFARMQEFAVSGDYPGAKQIGYRLLEEHAAYHDVALYLARIHGWESSFDSAWVLLDRVLESEPELYEAYATCADIAYWENNLEKLEACAADAAAIEPDSAGAFDSKIQNLKLAKVPARIPLQNQATELFGIYSYDHFTQPYLRNWHMLTAGAEIPFSYGTLVPHLNAGYQAAASDSPAGDLQLNLDAYLVLGRLNYALVGFGVSPDGRLDYFPGQRVAAEIWQVLPRGFGLSAGLRYFYWDRSFTFLTFSGEKYAGNYWFSLRNYLFFKDYGVSASWYLTARRYFESRYDYLSLTLGYGTAPDEPIDVVTDLERLGAVSARAEFSKKINPDIRLISSLGYSWEEYADQEYRNRIEFRLGAYFVIRK